MTRMTLSISALALLGLTGAFLSGSSGSNFEERFPVGPGGSLGLDVEFGGGISFDHGSVEVRSHEADDVRVVADTSGWGKYAVRLDLTQTQDRVELQGRVEGLLYWMFGGPTVDLAVWVPRDFTVEARIRGESLLLEDLTGPIRVELDGTDVTLRRAEGDVRLSSASGEIDVEDVEGDLEVRSEHGEIDVTGVRGAVRVAASHGRVEIESITGGVEVESLAGRLHGDVEIESVTGPVRVASNSGRVEVDRVRGDLSVTTERGRIDAEDVEGAVVVRTARGGIQLHEIHGAVQAHSDRGSIEVEFEGAPRGEISTGRGAIEVQVPEGASFDLDARTERGRVEIDDRDGFERDGGDSDSGRDRRRGDAVVRAVHGGGEALRLRSGRGSIELSE